MNVLVTGGAGYIGSHAVKYLQEKAGHQVVVVDNLSRGHRRAVKGEAILIVHELADWKHVARVMTNNQIECVMHFAAKAYVGESVERPLDYYSNNTADAVALLRAMDQAGVRKFVFSSTCATYGEPSDEHIPIGETCPQRPISPYGRSKLFVEQILRDYAASCGDFQYAMLRYFNVAGSDPNGEIGEDHDPETHLIPIILQAAAGLRPHIEIFGTDYATPDGTCVRDYVHVEDLIDAHMVAMEALTTDHPLVYNLGIGKGYSVREIIESARRVTGKAITIKEGPRRPGDPPRLFANPAKIKSDLGWQAKHTDIDDIVRTAWTWIQNHPHGYNGE
ncbi:MAG: UDP-glucose 4-epimerase GalE [Planctomycetes bacterium]|nr:UDP-glucose 4-epimerase GalE [Planctomycetota bacterium]NOG52863.1 UDP-glucose 4-epimerase GalE [Planctomycetota bacterium]